MARFSAGEIPALVCTTVIEDGVFIGMKNFGASGPYKSLFEHSGITADKVAAAAKAKL